MSLYNTIMTLKRKMQSVGYKETLSLVVKRLYYKTFNSKTLFFAIDLVNYDPSPQFLNDDVETREKSSLKQFTQTDCRSLTEYCGSRVLVQIDKKLAKGDRLFLIYLNNQVAGAIWVYEGGAGKFVVTPLSEKDFFILSVFTIDQFRRKGLSTVGLIQVLKRMKKEGFQRGYVCTKEWNFYQKAILKAGFHYVGKFREFWFMKKYILFWNSKKGRP